MKTILLVEDATDLAEVIDRELTASGYQVVHVGDGLGALDMLEKHTPDLMILDWMLPGLDGLEVLRRIRSTSSVTVLMLTARDAEADRVLGLEIGADDYLVKPFSMRELLARTRALFRRTEIIQQTLLADKAANNVSIQHKGLYIDTSAYRVTLDSQPLELSQTEFTLLHLLVRNAGRAFSRDYLLDTVWGQNYVEGDRAVDNAILRLRKKLGAMGAAIETVWGVGYRWHDSR